MPHAHLSVLLVEDDEVVRTGMRFALQLAQIQVFEAASVSEGLRGFLLHTPDMAVIDLHLPDGTGYELALSLWQLRPLLPLVMISADFTAGGTPPPRSRDDRPLALLAKPFSSSELLDAISRATAPTKLCPKA